MGNRMLFDKRKHLDVGLWGEKEAERYLKKKKYRILGRRVKMPPHDEIDLMARDGEVLVFVEVKTRKSESFGRPSESVDKRKRHILSRAAVKYLKALKYPAVYFRFDVVEVIGQPGGTETTIRHIENAFNLDKKYKLPF